MDVKYQVFVSSTYEDLRTERQEVIHALLELDCIPSGMELFPAADEDQWSLITGVIDECDYYILILGGRYGSIGNDGISYTEMEYRYALETGKPIIAFLHKDPESLPKKHTEQTEKGQEGFKAFRILAQQKMCKYWETPAELGSVVSRSLIMLQKKHPGIGWVRGNLVPDKEATIEILNLKKQIEDLKNKLEDARTKAPTGTEKLAQGEDDFRLRYTCSSSFEYTTYSWTSNVLVSWDDIFYCVSPLMIHEADDLQLKSALNGLVKEFGENEMRKMIGEKGHERLKDFKVDDDDFQTIKVQLRALGLIKRNDKTRSVKDTQTYWTLTPYGDNVMNRLRAIEKQIR